MLPIGLYNTQVFILIILIELVSLINARGVTVFTQTNVSTEYLTDPKLNLPFTSFLYIAAGQDATTEPPATIRIAQIPGLNASVPNATYVNGSSQDPDATLLYIQHLSNFTLPAAINSPNGLTWHANYIGDINGTYLDPHTLMRTWGTGLLADIWQIVAMDFDKRYWIPYADENIFILKLLDKWGATNSVGYQSYNRQLNSWRALTEGQGKAKQIRVQAMRIDMSSDGQGRVWQNGVNDIVTEGIDDSTKAPVRSVDFLKLAQNPNSFVPNSLQPSDSASSLHGASNIDVRGPVLPNTVYETKITFVRQAGIFSMLSVISEQTATVLNELVRVVAVAICIVDFIDGNYVGGALGLVGVAFATLFPLLFDNPLGIIYGTLIALLFFILPGAFKSAPTPPPTNNNTKIIQYAFFGDSDHTGNEKCAKQHPGCVASYGPGILALTYKWEWYDAIAFMIWANEGFPMTIPDMAKAFNNALSFDQDLGKNGSAVAQISCGDHPGSQLMPGRMGTMTWTAGNPNICSKPSFHFNRSNVILPRINRSAADVYKDIIDDDGGSCKIIDNADNPVTVPDYGIQIQGLPVAIACGINASVPGINYVSGSQATANVTMDPGTPITTYSSSTSTSSSSVSPVPSSSTNSSSAKSSSTSSSSTKSSSTKSSSTKSTSTKSTSMKSTSTKSASATSSSTSSASTTTISGNTQTSSSSSILIATTAVPSGWSPGYLSTDGRDGEGYVPPPAPSAFADVLYPGNSACFITDVIWDFFCLPNGTYDHQFGTFKFNSSKALTVRFPEGASVVVRYEAPLSRIGYVETSTTFKDNQTNNKNGPFAQDMQKMGALSFDVLVPNQPPPPLTCLYTKEKYKGDAMCFGVGGGNLTQGVGKIASVGIMGGATVTLYPHAYGDPGGLAFTVSVPDVSTIPYGTNSTFEGIISAIWVQQNITYITK